ncbi:unnamed protein product [Microthlaspi erraticum]|uniref:Agenet domain-containing protein n=1 Tax=Microthlaspi erraticum TaxID=1685480 RepID=A0A6D2J0J2_9BRAS|nr:unnamed protein product [Microthlaspi erraticum]
MRVAMEERLTMRVGGQVEVCYKDDGFDGIWYKTTIKPATPTKPKSGLHVTPLTAHSKNCLIRPVPPVHVQARISIEEGCVVDASRNDGWWTGLVVKEIEDNKFLVFFDSADDIFQFERKDLRPHLDWVDKKWWVVPKPKLQLFKRLTEESMFSSGTMVEVRSKLNKVEVIWVPAMIIREIEEIDKDDEESEEDDDEKSEDDGDDKEEIEDDDEEIEEENEDGKKYIVKFCDKSLSCEGSDTDETRLNKTVGLRSVRPTPPPFSVGEFQCMASVEAFLGTGWYQGQVTEILSQRRYTVLLKAKNEEFVFDHSDLRPFKVWEDGVWKAKDTPLSQASGNKMDGNTPSLTKEPGPPVTPSPGITPQPLKQAEAETQEKSRKRRLLQVLNQIGFGYDLTNENENNEDDNRKRKRVASVEENEANDTSTTMDLPFEKKLRIWKTVESMEVFKTVPQTPHFRPLVETQEDIREMSAVGMMFTYSDLLEEVKGLRFFNPISTFKGHIESFAVLEKHGSDVKEPLSRIQKLLSLKDRQAKKMEELIGAEKGISEKYGEMVENRRKILELQRLNEEAEKEIAQMKSSVETIDQELEDVELQFQTTASGPW